MAENQVDNTIPLPTSTVNNGNPPAKPSSFGKVGLALVPFTPVPFTGNGALYAWGRLVGYSGATLLLYKKNKTLATVMGIAAGISLATSLAAKSWE